VRRRFLIVLLALLGVFAAPGLANGDTGTSTGAPSKTDLGLSPDANAAIAYNTKDGSSLFQFAFAIRHVMNGIVDQQNAAVAYSRCNSCQTTAIAIEIVLVHGPTKNMSPQNAAIAVNESCTLCDTFASAYQFVIGVDGPVRLTRQGLRELWQIRREILGWGKDGVTNDTIKARLPILMARVKVILDTQLLPVQDEGDNQNNDNSNDQSQGQARDGPSGNAATTQTGTVQDTVPTPTTSTTTDTTPTTTTGPATTTGTTTTTP
jgi:putative peptide zinc metalloprotease protein